MRPFRAAAPPALLLFAALLGARASPAQDVAAVLSPAPGPYPAAFASFAAALGRDAAVFRLPERVAAPDARVIVAFGGEASLRPFPERATLISCLAPGLGKKARRAGAFVFISMRPAPGRLLAEMRRLQPGLRRLAVLSRGPAAEDYLPELRRAAAPLGIEIAAPSVDGPEGVPGALRSLLAAKPDAVWLAPDPSLVTPANFQVIAQFSWDNNVPFYAPSRGLAVAGAAASIYVSPEEQGRLAASLARRALAGEALPAVVYPEKTETAVNIGSARKAGLELAPQALGPGVEVLP